MDDLRGRDLVKVFADGTRALDGVSFRAREGKILALLGPSGCGKSTLLRIVAGLESPSSGSLELGERSLLELPPGQRGVGFVFQNYALYPHLDVAGNLGLALQVRKVPRAERDARIRETTELLGISDLIHRHPRQLSGGQQQRVALGRALIRRPSLYLLDEPLSNLDALLRESMRTELKNLFRSVEASVIYVTHDQAEAMSLADDLAVMRAGRIVQSGSPEKVYREPSDLFVATFVGSPRMTVWRGRRSDAGLLCDNGLVVPLPQPGSNRMRDGAPVDKEEELAVGIRPEDVEVSESPLPGGWPAELVQKESLGAQTLLTLRAGEGEARALAPPCGWPHRLWMRWPQECLHWFEGRSGCRLE